MLTRLPCLIALLLPACANEAARQPVAADPLAQPPGKRVLATVDGRAIAEEDVRASSLGALIVQPLLDRYRAEKGITASRQEVDACMRRAFGADASPDELAVRAGDEETRSLATHLVLDWKTSKQLYADYGGVVVFQQMNPMEPVGAYLAFLREQENRGAFCIHDRESAEAFWASFTRDPGQWRVAAEDVDYSVPWWEKVAKPARAAGK